MLIISKTKLIPEHPLTLFFMETLWKIIILKQKEKMQILKKTMEEEKISKGGL